MPSNENAGMAEELPHNDAAAIHPIATVRRWRIPHVAIVVGLLVAAHVAGVCIFDPPYNSDSLRYDLVFGVEMSQPILFAIWAALSRQPFVRRFLWCLMLCTSVAFIEDIVTLRPESGDMGIIMIFDFVIFGVATIALLPLRCNFAWQIQRRKETSAAYAYQTNQFGIRHLIILLTITGLAAGLFRTLLTSHPPEMYRYPTVSGFIVLYSVYLAVLAPLFVIPWYTLANRPRWLVLIAATVLLFLVFDTAVYLIVTWGVVDFPNNITLLIDIRLGAGVSILATTLPFRFCGYRMIRVRQ
jgi:hypothetical protein